MKQKKELLSRLRDTRKILIQKLLAEQKKAEQSEANTISRGVSFPPPQQLSSCSHPAANSTQYGLSCTRPTTPLRLLAVKTGDKEGDEESRGWHADSLRHNTTFLHEDDHRGHTHSIMDDFVRTSRATSCDLIQPDACTADVRRVRHDIVVFSAVKEVQCLEDRTAAHQQEVHSLEDRTAAHQQEVNCLEDRTAAHQQEVHCLEDRTAAHQQPSLHDDNDTMNHVALEISSPEESAELQTRRASQQVETEQNNAVDSTAAAITNKEGGCCALSGAEKPGEAFLPSATPPTSNASSSLSISHGMYLSFLSGHHEELEVKLCCDAASLNELESSLHVLHDAIKEIQQRRAFKRLHSNIVDLLPDMDHLATLHLYSTGSEQHAPLSGTRVPEVSCQRQQRLAQSLHFVLSHLPSQLIVAVTYEACSVLKREGAARAASSPRIAKSDALRTSLEAPGRSKLLLYGVGMVNIHETICGDNGDTVPNEPFPLHDIISIRPDNSRVRILSLSSLANNLLALHLNQQTTEDHEEKVGEEDQALQLGQASVTRRYSQLDDRRCCINDHPSSCGGPVATGHPLMPQATVCQLGENAKLPNVQSPMTETAALVGGKRKQCQQNQSNSSKHHAARHQSCSLYDIPPPAAQRQRSPLTQQCTRELIGRLGFGFKSNWKTDVKIVVGGRCVPHVVSVATNPKVVGVQDQQKLTALERISSSPAAEIVEDTAGVPDVGTASCTATATVIRTNKRLVTSGGGLTASNAAQVFTGSETAQKTEKGDEGSETQTQHPPLSLKDGDVYELPAGIRSLCSFEQWCKYSGLVMLKELQRKRVLSVKQRLHTYQGA